MAKLPAEFTPLAPVRADLPPEFTPFEPAQVQYPAEFTPLEAKRPAAGRPVSPDDKWNRLSLMTKAAAAFTYGIAAPLARPIELLTGEDHTTWQDWKYQTATGMERWGAQYERNAEWLARTIGGDNETAQEVIRALVRAAPQILSARFAAPGILEYGELVEKERPVTLPGQLTEIAGEATEFFMGIKGLARLGGAPITRAVRTRAGASAAMAVRALMATSVQHLQRPSLKPKEFITDAAAYFVIMRGAEYFQGAMQRVLGRVPAGEWIAKLREGNRLEKAFGSVLSKTGKTGEYLLITRADDWIESVFQTGWWALRERPDGTSVIPAFLGAIGPALALNYFSESFGSLTNMGIRTPSQTDVLRHFLSSQIERQLANAPRDLTADEQTAVGRVREILADHNLFKKTIEDKGLKPMSEALTQVLAEGQAAESARKEAQEKVADTQFLAENAGAVGRLRRDLNRGAKKQRRIREEIRGPEGPRHVLNDMQLLKMRYWGEMRGAAAATREAGRERRLVQEYRKELRKYVRSTVPSPVRGKMLTAIGTVKTPMDILHAVRKAETIAQDWDHKVARNSLRGALGKVDLRRMEARYRQPIQDIKEAVSIQGMSAAKRLNLEGTRRYLEQSPENNLPDYALAELARLDKIPASELTADQLRFLEASVKHAVKLQTLKRKLVIRGRTRDAQEAVNKITANIKRGKELAADFEREDTPAGIYWHWHDNLELACRLLDGKDDGEAFQLIYKVLDDAATAFIRANEGDKANLRMLLMERDLDKLTDFYLWSDYLPGRANREQIALTNGDQVEMTPANKIFFYLAAHDPAHRRSLLSRKGYAVERPGRRHWYRFWRRSNPHVGPMQKPLTEADILLICDSLTQEELLVAEAFSEFVNERIKREGNRASNEVVGFDVFTEANWWGKKTHRDYIPRKATGEVEERSLFQMTVEGQGFLRSRKAGARAPVVIGDAFQVIAEQIKGTGAYRAYAMPLRNVKMIMNSPKFRQTVRQRRGNEFLKNIERFVRRIEGESYRSDSIENMFKELRGRAAGAMLTLRIPVWVRQSLSYWLSANELDPMLVLKHGADVISDAQRLELREWTYEHMPQIWQRTTKGKISRDIGDIARGQEITYLFADDTRMGLTIGLRGGDSWAIDRIVLAAREEARRDAAEGTLQAQIDAEAARLAEKAIRRTQPTWHMKDRTILGGSPTAAVQMLTMFRSFRDKKLLADRYAWAKYVEGDRNRADFLRMTRKWTTGLLAGIVLDLLWTSFYRFVTGRKSRADTTAERARETAWRGIEKQLDFFFGVGPLFRVARMTWEQHFYGFDPMQTPVMETFENIGTVFGDVIRLFDEFLSKEVYKAGPKTGEEKWLSTGRRILENLAETTGRLTGIPFEGMVEFDRMIEAWGKQEEGE